MYTYTDISYLQQITKNNYDIIRLTIDKYSVSIPDVMSKLEYALQKKDYNALGAEAHKFLSTVSILKIKTMEGLVRQLEADSKERQNLENFPAMVGEVRKLSEFVMVELEEHKIDLDKEINLVNRK